MVERGMDHAIRCGRAAAQACQVLQRAAMRLGTRRRKRGGAGFRAGEAEHLVPGGD